MQRPRSNIAATRLAAVCIASVLCLTNCESLKSAGNAIGGGVDRVHALVDDLNEKADQASQRVDTAEAKAERTEGMLEDPLGTND